ncbi:MAG TPA: VWA domain-containing protein [Bryobacteraceae bacterium]|nr:VWA domain-containing protein [Bryobacteraceae bacterium]
MSLTRRLFTSAALTLPAWAQKAGEKKKPEPKLPEEEEGDLARFVTFTRQVIAPTTVTDKDGNYVNNIQPHEFRLIDRGASQKINVEIAANQPLSLVVCLQANNTVESVLPNVKKIGPLLEGTILGEHGQAALIAFDHRIRLMQDWTRDSNEITKALNKVNAGSTTSAMTDAVIEAARMLSRRPKDHRKVILLISETRDKGSEAKTRQALLALQFGNIVLYSLNINRLVTSLLTKQQPPRPPAVPASAGHAGPGGGGLMTPESTAQYTGHYNGNAFPLVVEVLRQAKSVFVDNQLEAYTKATGGSERAFLSYKDLERVVMDIGEELQSQYLISYSPSNPSEGGYHEINVEVLRSGLRVRTRPGYWMAAIPEHLR